MAAVRALCGGEQARQVRTKSKYTVKVGDSCASITRALFGGSQGALELANPGFKCCDDFLYVGFEICTSTGEEDHPLLSHYNSDVCY